MADTKYVVEVEVNSTGNFESKIPGALGRATQHADNFESKLNKVHGGLERLVGTARSVGSTMMAPFDAAAHAALGFGTAMAKVGAIAAFGAITAGVVSLNGELERTQISMATIMNANGMNAGGIHGGMKVAADQMQKMRKDAAALPGEFMDLANIMRTGMIPGAHAGLGVDQMRQMSAKVMAAGAVSGLPMDQVAREFAQLMEGRAGAHNVFGMRLMGLSGDSAEKFNKSDAASRAKMISESLDKFAPAIEVFKTSWEGLSSTFVDNVKRFGGLATAPLFENIKGTLADVNAWFDKNQDKVEGWAEIIGKRLSEAFDWAKSKLEEWWPVIQDFAINAYNTFGRMWKEASPTIEKAAEVLKEFLRNPNAVNMMVTAGKGYVAAKAGGAVLGGVADVGLGAMGLASTLKTLGIIGGGTATAATATTTTVAGGAGAAAGGSAFWAPVTAAVSGTAAAFAPLITLLGAGAAATVGVALAADQATKLYEEIEQDRLANVQMYIDVANRNLEGVKGIAADSPEVRAAIAGLRQHGEEAAAAQLELKLAALGAASALDAISLGKRMREQYEANEALNPRSEAGQAAMAAVLQAAEKYAKEHKGKGGRHPGGGGTNIARVEIVVTSNESPSRIARMVLSEMQNIQRHPKVSRDVPNYSAP